MLPKVESASQSVLRDAIRHERRVELALEPDRFYDLVRWGIAKEVLQAAGKNYQDKNALLPLPQTEIDKSNGVLVQTPDYCYPAKGNSRPNQWQKVYIITCFHSKHCYCKELQTFCSGTAKVLQ